MEQTYIRPIVSSIARAAPDANSHTVTHADAEKKYKDVPDKPCPFACQQNAFPTPLFIRHYHLGRGLLSLHLWPGVINVEGPEHFLDFYAGHLVDASPLLSGGLAVILC